MPFFGGGFDPFENMNRMMQRQMRDMETMMDSMMDPFGMMAGGSGYGHINPRQQMIQDDLSRGRQVAHPQNRSLFGFNDDMGMMMPFGGGLFGGGGGGGLFTGMNNMVRQMETLNERAASDPNSHVYSQSTVISMTPGADGRMQYYESTDSLRKAGGVKETRKTLRDSARGVEQMSVGHHIGQRGHVIEKRRGRNGKIEENQEFIGLGHNDAKKFDEEWGQATQQSMRGGPADRAIEGASRREARERHASPYTKAKDRKKPKGPIIEEID